MSASFEIRRLRLGEILDEGFKVFRRAFGRFILFQLILYFPGTVVLALTLDAGGDLLIEIVESGTLPDIGRMLVVFGASLAAIAAVQVIVAPISAVALTRGVAETYLSRPWTIGSILRETLERTPRAIGAGIVLVMLLFACIGVPFALLAGVALVFASGSALGGDIVSIVLLVLFGGLAVLGASVGAGYVYLRYALAFTALAIEDVPIGASFRRSARLVAGRYGQALALLVILVVAGGILGGVLSSFVPSPSFEGLDPDELKKLVPPLIRSQILATVLGQAAGVLTNTYTVICWTLFYFSTRCEKEGFDLAFLAERFAGGEAR